MFPLPDYYLITITPQHHLCLVLVCFKLSSLQALNVMSFYPKLKDSLQKQQCCVFIMAILYKYIC